jgi:acyl dehydratase
MTIDYQTLANWTFFEKVQTYGWKDTALYALAVGLGADPMSEAELKFVYEPRLHALPTMAAVLAGQGFWIRDPATGIDWANSLHGEEEIVLHKPLPATGTVRGRMRVESLIDKGPEKGALLTTCNDLHDAESDELIASVYATSFNRSDGGFGGPKSSRPPAHPTPERAPDQVVDLPTLPQSALLYRLNGDDNPLHAEPAIAIAAGFSMPILHGLCTFGVAGHALLKAVCGYEPARMKSLRARFSAPVYPGETIRTEIWRADDCRFAYRCRVLERDIAAITGGLMQVRE